MSIQQELKSFGFIELPEFGPDYFNYRGRVGFILLLNEKRKLCYQIFTINARSWLYTASRMVNGEPNIDRARDLRDALKTSCEEDWTVYFRPNGLYPSLRNEVKKLTEDYQSLNTWKPRIDQNESTWSYEVYHKGFKRSFTMVVNERLTDEDVIAQFLYRWRKYLNDSNKRRALSLPLYYVGCRQLAEATKQWMDRNTKAFLITEIEELAGKPRREAVSQTKLTNARRTKAYRQTLAA